MESDAFALVDDDARCSAACCEAFEPPEISGFASVNPVVRPACAARKGIPLGGIDIHKIEHERYPVERRLSMDPRTGDYALVNGRSYRRRPLDAAWVLERFPPRAA